MDCPTRPYGHVAWCYDAAASAYSLGAIGRAKRWHIGRVGAGQRVLYIGAGTGREAAALCAARPGVAVVCVEPCAAMARRLRRRLSPWADRVTIVEEALRAARGSEGFDWVCGHFFFNVFDAEAMPRVLAMAASHVKPGGRMVVADFSGRRPMPHGRKTPVSDPSPSEGEGWGGGRQHGPWCHPASTGSAGPSPQPPPSKQGGGAKTERLAGKRFVFSNLFRAAYYRPVNIAGWGLGMCALHPIYDYGPALEGLGLLVEARVGFTMIPGTPAFYEVVCARKEQGG